MCAKESRRDNRFRICNQSGVRCKLHLQLLTAAGKLSLKCRYGGMMMPAINFPGAPPTTGKAAASHVPNTNFSQIAGTISKRPQRRAQAAQDPWLVSLEVSPRVDKASNVSGCSAT